MNELSADIKQIVQDCLVRVGLDYAAEDIELINTPVRIGAVLDQLIVKKSNTQNRYKVGGYTLDIRSSSLQDDDGKNVISLTEKEVAILAFLAAQQGVVNRQSLLDNVWGYADNVETHTLETHIYRLRQKIEKDPSSPIILTTTEDGYKLC